MTRAAVPGGRAVLFTVGTEASPDDYNEARIDAVVVATGGLAVGGGCEIALHADRVQAAAETYIGLVEVGDHLGLAPREAEVGQRERLGAARQLRPVGAATGAWAGKTGQQGGR